jgi:hypothetical protein
MLCCIAHAMGTRPSPYLIAVRALHAAVLLLVAACFAAPAAAQSNTYSIQSEVRVAVVTSGSLVKARDLHFGDIIAGPVAGTVTVTVTGGRTSTGGVTLVGNSHHPALFVGRGQRNQQIEISFGAPTIQITGPGAPMTVSLFQIGEVDGSLRGNRPGRYRITTRDGMFTFPVGATLSVNANQRSGSYSGQFEVIYEFQ